MFDKLLKPAQALKFAIIGIAATLTHLFVSTLLIHYFFEQATLATFAGYCIALPVSFFGHAKLTYQAQLSFSLFFKFFFNTAWILGLSLLAAFIFDQYSVNKYFATVFSVLLFPLVSYIVHTYLTFQDKTS